MFLSYLCRLRTHFTFPSLQTVCVGRLMCALPCVADVLSSQPLATGSSRLVVKHIKIVCITCSIGDRFSS